jgi:hypothetical protein
MGRWEMNEMDDDSLRSNASGGRGEFEDLDPVHTWFGLTYSNYLVLHRSLLQSMPNEWQVEFVRLLDQMQAAFRYVDQAESYEVTAGEEALVNELGDAERKRLGITTSLDDMSDEEYEDFDGEVFYYDKNGDQLESYQRVHLPGAEPVPHYNRGRTRIAPDMEAYHTMRNHSPEASSEASTQEGSS